MKKIISFLVLATLLTAVMAMTPVSALARNIGDLPDGSAYLQPPGGEIVVEQPPVTGVNPTPPTDNGGNNTQGGTDGGSTGTPQTTTGTRTELPKTGDYYEFYVLIGLSMMVLGVSGIAGQRTLTLDIEK